MTRMRRAVVLVPLLVVQSYDICPVAEQVNDGPIQKA